MMEPDARLKPAALLLGLALGGFFDGILLHQVLQWHHLLSALEGERFADPRVQILADGLFHAAMYLVAMAGLLLLWRGRAGLREMPGRVFAARFLVGFGLWHVLDAVLSHWLSGIHRIRMDAPDPLFWDLLWLCVFGLVPLAAAFLLGRAKLRLAGATLPVMLLAATLGAGAIAARAPEGTDVLTVVLRPDVPAGRFIGALDAGARIVWSDARGTVWIVRPGPDTSRRAMYRDLALFVGGGGVAAGCAAWLK